MSDHVIIVGVKRAKQLVPATELLQMAGRVGRKQDGLSYVADIILNDDDFEVENTLNKKEEYVAISTFNDIQKFCFYLLPEIVNENIKNKNDIETYYNRSFCHFQNNKLSIDKILSYLVENQAINENFEILPLAKIASKFYMHIEDVKLLKDNFTRVLNEDLGSDGACAWALGNLSTIKINGDFGDHREEINRFESDLPVDYKCKEGYLITSALWWCMMGNGVPGKNMTNNVRQLKKHFGRIIKVLECLGFDKTFVKELDLRIKKNIIRELVPFFDDPLMTKQRACSLKWMGYSNSIGTENIKLEDLDE